MKLKSLLSPVLFFLLSLDYVSGQEICSSELLEPNSTNDLNRRQILSSVASNVTAHNGFFNSSIGQDPNRIFIIGMCIPGTTPESCSDCIKGASDGLLQSCPNQTAAYTWPDCCMVRYSNISFSGSLVMEPSLRLYNTGDITSNLTMFDRIWEELMARAITAASLSTNGSSFSFGHKYFAAEVASLTTSQTIYTMMQCTPDVSSEDCEFCLKKNVGEYEACCHGKQGGAVIRPSCFFRWDLYPFAGAFEDPPPPPPPQCQPQPSSKFPVVLVLLFVFYICRRRKLDQAVEVQVGDEIITTRSQQFSLNTIEAATCKFADSNMIGRGGYGEVYRGTLASGAEVAVKRLSKTSGQGAQEFKNEAVLVAHLYHRNLVRLFGFSSEGEEKILIYEFVPNKSLDYFLFDPAKQGELDWKRRYNIIGGIARGILYLHQDSPLTIIHRDLKATNILLDAHFNPKIADFGMARIFGVDQSQANTRQIVGTYGYMSPECAMYGHFSIKSDVYSFGILILEIISGQKNSSFYYIGDSGGNLVSHVWRLWRNGEPLEIMDRTIGESYQTNEVTRCIHVALLCIQQDPAERPTLPAIIVMLTSSTTTLPAPLAPSFYLSSSNELDLDGLVSILGSISDELITDRETRRRMVLS